MEKRYWFVMKDNYVINYIVWDGITPYTYPFEHDYLLEDIDGLGGIGDWYEASEAIFYRPVGKTPPDYPTV
jgi:hypothetical protein